jgi:hypothetical protein
VNASGVALPGSITTYTFAEEEEGETYYGWAVATKHGAESDVIGTAPLTTKNPEAWWAAGVNINYRTTQYNTNTLNYMIQIRNTSGFIGGSISPFDVVYSQAATGYDVNLFPDLNYLKSWSIQVPIDSPNISGWNIVSKFGNNANRKKVMDFIKTRTGSESKPEFKTWTE